MRRGVAVVLSVLVLQAAAAAGELEVRARDGLVSIRARDVPLREVLDRLARETGMKVVYDGAPPGVAVSTTVEELAEREAVVRLFEGLGLSYAFMLDAGGTRVATLLVAGPAAASVPGPRTSRAAVPGRPQPVEPPEEPFELPSDEAAPLEPDDPDASSPEGPVPGAGTVTAPATPRPLSPPHFPAAASFPRPLSFPSGVSQPRAW